MKDEERRPAILTIEAIGAALERRLKLPLCPDCRRGIGETVSNR